MFSWWIPVFFSAITTGLMIISQFVGNNTFINVSFILFGVGVVVLIISLIYQIAKRRWLRSIATFIILVVTVVCVFLFTLFMSVVSAFSSDHYADDLKIPANIPIENPIALISIDERPFRMERPDSMLLISKSKMDFQLYSSLQPGLYEYDFWVGKIESGTIFLKAFEITHEDELSTGNLPERSSVSVVNITDSIRKFGTTSCFTIYEGDWGKPYAARFEVWFKPDNGGAERKLVAKNYKLEGWEH